MSPHVLFRTSAALVLLALAGCAREAATPDTGGSTPVVDCGERAFHAALREQQATLYLPGIALSLPRANGENGKRYAGNGYELHREGERVRFVTPEESWTDCAINDDYNPWARAWLQGVRFRAFGHEPGWVLEIRRERRLHLQWQYGESNLTTQLEEAELDKDLVIYRGRTDDHGVRIEILEHRCRDSGRGGTHTHAVRLTIDGEVFHGCGRGLAPVEAAAAP